MFSKLTRTLCLGAAFFLAAGPALVYAQTGEDRIAEAELKTPDGKEVGTVDFIETPNGVLVDGELHGLPVGYHAIHIHEVGSCKGDFKSAGGHFAPNGHKHGFAESAGYHAGDLPNVNVGNDGTAEFQFFDAQIGLGTGKTSLMDADGSSVIVHADKDSYLSNADAGSRIACGVIVEG